MVRINGFKEALSILSGLDSESAEKLLIKMAEKDPQLVEQLRKELVSLEDLIHITPKMLVELMREINIDDLALALRLASKELRQFFLQNLSKSMVSTINDVLEGEPRPKSKVLEAQDRVMQVVMRKVAKKEIILNKNGEEMV